MKTITRLLATAALLFGVLGGVSSVKAEKNYLRFTCADYCNATWDSETHTFTWGAIEGKTAEWVFTTASDISGDLSSWTKLHLHVSNFTNASANKLTIIFKKNDGSWPPNGPTKSFEVGPDESGDIDIDLTSVNWGDCDISNIQDLTIYGCARDDESQHASVEITDAYLYRPSLEDLKAGYGSDSDWLIIANGITYPIEVKDVTLFGSDGTSQTTNADVKNYDYLYVTVTEFKAAKAVRIFFWDKYQNKRFDYYLKPVANKETANFEEQTNITDNGTYCVKVPEGARLQGAKPAQGSSSTVSFKFSEIYLTERATPYVEPVPYTLVYSNGSANIPISESHIRTSGNVSINYSTGELTSTGGGNLIIYLKSEDLIGATRYVADVTDNNVTKLEPTFLVVDAVNGELPGIYSSRYNWSIATDGERNTRIGSVTALRYDFSQSGSLTINSLRIEANELIIGTTEKNLTDLPYGSWGLPANKVSNYIGDDSYKTNNIDGKSHDGLLYGHDGNSDSYKYVDLTNCSKIIFTGLSDNGGIRLFYNWSGTNEDKPIETINGFPTTSGTYTFDIDAFKKAKGLSFFHLNGIKTNWGNATFSSVKVVEYTNVISGSGIDRTKSYRLNPYITSIDATGVTAATALTVPNPNCLITANAGMVTNAQNVIVDGTCSNLVLTDGHPFKAPSDFTANTATYTTTINTDAEAGTLCLPFAATIPSDVKAWTLNYTSGDEATANKITTGTIPANTPVLLNGSGPVTFSGASAAIDADAANTSGALTGVFVQSGVPKDSYILQNQTGNIGFYKVATANTNVIKPFRAYLTIEGVGPSRLSIDFIENDEPTGVGAALMNNEERIMNNEVYNLCGQRVEKATKGLYIKNGKKVIMK